MARLNIPKRELGGQQIQLGDVGGIGRAREKLEEAGDFTRVVDSAMRLGSQIASMAGESMEQERRERLQGLGTKLKADHTRAMTNFENRVHESSDKSPEAIRQFAQEESEAQINFMLREIENFPDGADKETLKKRFESDSDLIRAGYESAASTLIRRQKDEEEVENSQRDARQLRRELEIYDESLKSRAAELWEDFADALQELTEEELAGDRPDKIAEEFANRHIRELREAAERITDPEEREHLLSRLEAGKGSIAVEYRTKARSGVVRARDVIVGQELSEAADRAMRERDFEALSEMIGGTGTVASDRRLSLDARLSLSRDLGGAIERELANVLTNPDGGWEEAMRFSLLPQEVKDRFSERLHKVASEQISNFSRGALRAVKGTMRGRQGGATGGSGGGSGSLTDDTSTIDRARNREFRETAIPLLKEVIASDSADSQAKADAEAALGYFEYLEKVELAAEILASDGREIVGDFAVADFARQIVGERLREDFRLFMQEGYFEENGADIFAAKFRFSVEQLGSDQSLTADMLSNISFELREMTPLFLALDREISGVRNNQARRAVASLLAEKLKLSSLLEHLEPGDKSLVRAAINAAINAGEVGDLMMIARGDFSGIEARLDRKVKSDPDFKGKVGSGKEYDGIDPAVLLMSKEVQRISRNVGGKEMSLDDAIQFVLARPQLAPEFYAQIGSLGRDMIEAAAINAVENELPNIGPTKFSTSGIMDSPPESYFEQAHELLGLEMSHGSLRFMETSTDNITGAILVEVSDGEASYHLLHKTQSGSTRIAVDENGDFLEFTVGPKSSRRRYSHLRRLQTSGYTEEQVNRMGAVERETLAKSLSTAAANEEGAAVQLDSTNYAAGDLNDAREQRRHLENNPYMTTPALLGGLSPDLISALLSEGLPHPSLAKTPWRGFIRWPVDEDRAAKNAAKAAAKAAAEPPHLRRLDFRLSGKNIERGLEGVMARHGIDEASAQALLETGRAVLNQHVSMGENPKLNDALITPQQTQAALFFLEVAAEASEALYFVGASFSGEKPIGWSDLPDTTRALRGGIERAQFVFSDSIRSYVNNVTMPMAYEFVGEIAPPGTTGGADKRVEDYVVSRIGRMFFAEPLDEGMSVSYSGMFNTQSFENRGTRPVKEFQRRTSGFSKSQYLDMLAEATATGTLGSWSDFTSQTLVPRLEAAADDAEAAGRAAWEEDRAARLKESREASPPRSFSAGTDQVSRQVSPERRRQIVNQIVAQRPPSISAEEARAAIPWDHPVFTEKVGLYATENELRDEFWADKADLERARREREAQIIAENVRLAREDAKEVGIDLGFWDMANASTEEEMAEWLELQQVRTFKKQNAAQPLTWDKFRSASPIVTSAVTTMALRELVRAHELLLDEAGISDEKARLEIAVRAYKKGMRQALEDWLSTEEVPMLYRDYEGSGFQRTFILGDQPMNSPRSPWIIELPWPPVMRRSPDPTQAAAIRMVKDLGGKDTSQTVHYAGPRSGALPRGFRDEQRSKLKEYED